MLWGNSARHSGVLIMTKFKSQGVVGTFKNAGKGLLIVLKSEANLRTHTVIAVLTLLAGIFLKFTLSEFCLLLFLIGLVIVSEMLNTAIEFTIDSVYHNKYSRMAGMAKDISAGAVMFAAFIGMTAGAILFMSKILQL